MGILGRPFSHFQMTATTQTKAQIDAALQQISRYTHNRQTSARLLYAQRQANKDHSLQWCVDKTIQELLRDRR